MLPTLHFDNLEHFVCYINLFSSQGEMGHRGASGFEGGPGLLGNPGSRGSKGEKGYSGLTVRFHPSVRLSAYLSVSLMVGLSCSPIASINIELSFVFRANRVSLERSE